MEYAPCLNVKKAGGFETRPYARLRLPRNDNEISLSSAISRYSRNATTRAGDALQRASLNGKKPT
jgi:hypothetical protein